MIIKIIQHDKMKQSIDYLYKKSEKSNTPLVLDNSFFNKEDYHERMSFLTENYNDISGKKTKENTNYKHVVLSFAHEDKFFVNENYNLMVDEFCENLGIDKEENNVIAFLHNDRKHPHIHLCFSRINNELKPFNDEKIGWKFRDISTKLNNKYKLTPPKANRVRQIHKNIYAADSYSDLLKIMEYASYNSENINDFRRILRENNIISKKDISGKSIYEFNNKKIHQNILPVQYKDLNLFKTIKTNQFTRSEKEIMKSTLEVISKCKTPNEIAELFPDSILTFKKNRNNDKILNVEIKIGDNYFSMNQYDYSYQNTLDYNKLINTISYGSDNIENLLNFTENDRNDETHLDKKLKNKKKRRPPRFKN